jgi:hypothetical protein
VISHRIRPIVALVALFVIPYTATGCSDQPEATPQPTATVTPAPTTPSPTVSSTPAVDREITITVARKKVTPAPGRVQVAKGSTVRITVTSDVKDSVHVHGYDLTFELSPGTPGSVQFRADQDGLFEVETHDTKLVLFQLLVR